MHFHPSRRIIHFGRQSKTARTISALLEQEWEIWRFPRAVFDAIRALHAITNREPWERVRGMVSHEIEQETLGYLMAWSDRVGRVLKQMDPEDVEQLRQEFRDEDIEDGDDQ